MYRNHQRNPIKFRVNDRLWQNRPLEAVHPQSRLQRCIVHQIHSSTRFVNWKDIKQVMADLKKIYTAVTLNEAEDWMALSGFAA